MTGRHRKPTTLTRRIRLTARHYHRALTSRPRPGVRFVTVYAVALLAVL